MHRYYAVATRENQQTKKLTRAGGSCVKELDFNRLSEFDRWGFQNNEKPLRVVPGRHFLFGEMGQIS
jgi:hypothetical protein